MPNATSNANPFAAPVAEVTAPQAPASPEAGIFERDRYMMKQKLIAINERYSILGEDGQELIWVRRRQRVLANLAVAFLIIAGSILGIVIGAAMGNVLGGILAVLIIAGSIVGGIAISPLRHLEICTDPEYREVILQATQDNRFAFPIARFTLRDAHGKPICRFRKNVLWNIFRRRWYIDSTDGALMWVVKEDSVLKAIIRRVAPEIIAAFMRTNFVFLDPTSGRQLGIFNRKLAIRDHYVLDLTQDPDRRFDRRIALTMGVLLDTGERR